MASTAADIVTGGLLNINSYSPGEVLSAQDGDVGLNALNDLLSSLSNDEAFVYTQVETIFPWITGQFQYAVGPSGADIIMPRPLRFRSGFSRASTSGIANLDYTFTFTDFDNYKRELLKNVQGPWPYVAAYQPTFPNGTLYVYPAPGSSYTAHLFSDLILSEFATITTAYALPQGYTRALKKLLALELAPIYGKTVSSELRMQAKEAKDLIKGTNAQPVPVMQFDSAISRSQTQDAGWAQNGGFT